MRKHLPLLAAALLVFATQVAHADPILLFNSFGPGNTYGVGARPILGPGYPLSEGDVTPGQWVAASFDAFRVFAKGDLDVAPVPEPGSLLLVGAGLVGAWRAGGGWPRWVADSLMCRGRASNPDGPKATERPASPSRVR
jgi:hypothetical protein